MGPLFKGESHPSLLAHAAQLTYNHQLTSGLHKAGISTRYKTIAAHLAVSHFVRENDVCNRSSKEPL